jgi:hypothetical protein
MWDEQDTLLDHRSDDARLFQLPVVAQGPTYFRWSCTEPTSDPLKIALFLDYGMGKWGAGEPFARLAVLVDDKPSSQSMSRAELEQFASALFDEIDRREKLGVTLPSGAPDTALVPHRFISSVPIDQLRRLVTALFDAADSLDICGRTGIMRARNPDA